MRRRSCSARARRAPGAMLVGEQPGDAEDLQGRPFVGPAGLLLRRVLGEVGLDERDLYLTNAVKHFKWRPKGTRRIHDTPNWTEIRACDIWLRLELAEVAPELLVCLGATATPPGARARRPGDGAPGPNRGRSGARRTRDRHAASVRSTPRGRAAARAARRARSRSRAREGDARRAAVSSRCRDRVSRVDAGRDEPERRSHGQRSHRRRRRSSRKARSRRSGAS